MEEMAACNICFHNCILNEGCIGACRTRIMKDGKIVSLNYGQVTSLALDPIEKKPLNRFYPGSNILSVGSYGCNLRCPFCQNVSISMADGRQQPESEYVSPERLSQIAMELVSKGNIGIAYTYNEPLMSFEYIRDTARLIHEQGMKNVIVTNGSVKTWVLDEIKPYIDAMNIDLKCFREDYYREVLKGDFATTKAFIEKALAFSHVELTTLIIPNENDSEEEMRELSAWVHGLELRYHKKIPLHISRFFPRSAYRDRRPTEVGSVLHLAKIAREQLEYVYEGNL